MMRYLGMQSALISTVAGCAVAVASPGYAQSKSFNVPAQPAISGIPELARQADVQILVSESAVRGKTTRAVKGDMTVEQALHQLLKGTGLHVSSTDGRTFSLTSVNQSKNSATTLESEETPEDIIVTGTNIRGVSPASPVTTSSRQDIEASGYTTVGGFLQSLPQNFSGGQNPNVAGVGSSGVSKGRNNLSQSSSPNLRGIGSDSTLTLIDGHRLGFDGNLGSVDISLVPLIAVERIEVVPDGASALYGSDAVAGVVNVVLRKNYSGLETEATLGGPTEGGAFQQQYSVIAGHSFDRGNIDIAYEHAHDDNLLASQRSVSSAALSPFDLSPRQNHDSIFLSGNYDLSPVISGHISGIYSAKENTTDYNTTGTITNDNGRVRQFGVNGGIDYAYGNGGGSLWTPRSRETTNACRKPIRPRAARLP